MDFLAFIRPLAKIYGCLTGAELVPAQFSPVQSGSDHLTM